MIAKNRSRASVIAGLEIGHRQREQVPKQARAQFDVDPVGCMREQIGSKAAEHDLEHREYAQAERENLQGRQAAVHEDLVDDDLEEERRQQSKNLQEERGDQDVGQRLAIFLHRVDEPGHAEPPIRIGEGRAAGHQDQAAVPEFGEAVAGQQFGFERRGVLDEHLAFRHLADHEPAAVPQPAQGRQRRVLQALQGGAYRARLDRITLGFAQDFRLVQRRPATMVKYLRSIGGHAQKLQQKGERRGPGVHCSRRSA
jgi:hypothetical protein